MVAAPAYNWTGLYLGAHFGGAFAGDAGIVTSLGLRAVTSGL